MPQDLSKMEDDSLDFIKSSTQSTGSLVRDYKVREDGRIKEKIEEGVRKARQRKESNEKFVHLVGVNLNEQQLKDIKQVAFERDTKPAVFLRELFDSYMLNRDYFEKKM